jgi:hypothetical protein
MNNYIFIPLDTKHPPRRLISATALIFLIAALLAACNPVNNPSANNDSLSIVNSPLRSVSGSEPSTDIEPTGNPQLDSLLLAAATAPQDTNLIRLYTKIGDMFLYNDNEKAKAYYLKIKTLNEKLNWSEGHYLFAACIADILN